MRKSMACVSANPLLRRKFLLRWTTSALAIGGLAGHSARAQDLAPEKTVPVEVAAALDKAQWAGAARLRFFGFDVYDSKLWVTPGFSAKDYAQTPFALELTYLRNLDGKAIAERSLKEMRRSGKFSAEVEQRWLTAMEKAFPDVKAGDRLTGLHRPGIGAIFFFNGQARATIADADFSRYFFGIWLSENTSEPQMRSNLLARANP